MAIRSSKASSGPSKASSTGWAVSSASGNTLFTLKWLALRQCDVFWMWVSRLPRQTLRYFCIVNATKSVSTFVVTPDKCITGFDYGRGCDRAYGVVGVGGVENRAFGR